MSIIQRFHHIFNLSLSHTLSIKACSQHVHYSEVPPHLILSIKACSQHVSYSEVSQYLESFPLSCSLYKGLFPMCPLFGGSTIFLTLHLILSINQCVHYSEVPPHLILSIKACSQHVSYSEVSQYLESFPLSCSLYKGLFPMCPLFGGSTIFLTLHLILSINQCVHYSEVPPHLYLTLSPLSQC